jgi:hypothetical protein
MSSTSPYAEPKDLKPGDFLQSTWGDLFYVEKMQKNGLARVVNCSTGYKTKVEPNLFFLLLRSSQSRFSFISRRNFISSFLLLLIISTRFFDADCS